MSLGDPVTECPKDVFDDDPRVLSLAPGEVKVILDRIQRMDGKLSTGLRISDFTERHASFYVNISNGWIDVALVRKDDMKRL